MVSTRVIRALKPILVGLIGLPTIAGGYFLCMVPVHLVGEWAFSGDHGYYHGKPYNYASEDGWVIAGFWLPFLFIALGFFWAFGQALLNLRDWSARKKRGY